MPPAATIVHDMAVDLLEVVGDALEAKGVTLPERQYVHVGEVADDCEQLVVSVPRLYVGLPSAQDLTGIRCSSSITVELHPRLTVCVPTVEGDPPTFPSAEELNQAGMVLGVAGWAMLQGVVAAVKGDLWTSCQEVVVGDLLAHGPAGGYSGWDLTVRVMI